MGESEKAATKKAAQKASEAEEVSEEVAEEAAPQKTFVLRTRSQHHVFKTEHGTITGSPTEYPADVAQKIVTLAQKCGVGLHYEEATQR